MCSPMGSSPMLGTVLEAWCWDQPSARPHLSVYAMIDVRTEDCPYRTVRLLSNCIVLCTDIVM